MKNSSPFILLKANSTAAYLMTQIFYLGSTINLYLGVRYLYQISAFDNLPLPVWFLVPISNLSNFFYINCFVLGFFLLACTLRPDKKIFRLSFAISLLILYGAKCSLGKVSNSELGFLWTALFLGFFQVYKPRDIVNNRKLQLKNVNLIWSLLFTFSSFYFLAGIVKLKSGSLFYSDTMQGHLAAMVSNDGFTLDGISLFLFQNPLLAQVLFCCAVLFEIFQIFLIYRLKFPILHGFSLIMFHTMILIVLKVDFYETAFAILLTFVTFGCMRNFMLNLLESEKECNHNDR